MEELQKVLTGFFVKKSMDILGAIAILAAGYILSRYLGKIVQETLEKKNVEPPIRALALRFSRLLIFLLVLVIALDTLGVPITPLIAGLSVAGLGVGLAMQGVLGNLVAGLVIIFSKPFRVGEFIEIVGVHGVVINIELLATTLEHADRSLVKIPNRKIIGEILHNYGKIRQLDLSVGISYNADAGAVLATVRQILSQNPRVLKDPAPAVGIASLGDSSVTVAIKPWTSLADFGPAAAELNQSILETFRSKQIEIPFPQREVRLLNDPAAAGQPPVRTSY